MTEELETNYEYLNKKRINSKKEWIKILNSASENDQKAIDVLLYLYDCKNYTSNGKEIAKFFNTEVGAINVYIKSFGAKIIKEFNIEEQIYGDGHRRRWNLFFETVPELNKNNIFTWKLRKELIDAMVQIYDLVPKEYESLEDKFQMFIKEYLYEECCESIKNDLEVREEFVKRFTVKNIMNLTLDEFVIGRADIDEKGKSSFCYLIERKMTHLGQMLGSYVSKFGVWYSKDNNQYEHTKRYGKTLDEAFENLKKEICDLLISANNKDYDAINKCKIADIFKGKILSTYYPEEFLCVFDKDDIEKFLYLLNIEYDIHEVNTLEKKKKLLVDFKNNNKLLKEYSDYYFVVFLYTTFKEEIKIKNTVSGAIDYNIEFVNFDYIKNHEVAKKKSYRSRNTDYERINRNKKDVGNRGEDAILQHEIKKLESLGLNDLAKQVRKCDNDAIGYDIESFNENGEPICIEVKTSSNKKTGLDFYITDNELYHLINDDNYYIYYLFNIKGNPKCHIINKKEILKNNREFFQPVIYKVNVDIIEKDTLDIL